MDPIDNEDSSEDRSSFVDDDGVGPGVRFEAIDDSVASASSNLATAAATPNRTARSRSGRSKM